LLTMNASKLRKNGRTRSGVALEIASRIHGIGTGTGPKAISREDAELLQNSDFALFRLPGGYLTPAEAVQFSVEKERRGR
jgi:hypothetical protein